MHAEFVVENDVVRALVPGEGNDRAGGCAKMRWVLEVSRDALFVELMHRKRGILVVGHNVDVVELKGLVP